MAVDLEARSMTLQRDVISILHLGDKRAIPFCSFGRRNPAALAGHGGAGDPSCRQVNEAFFESSHFDERIRLDSS